LHVQALISGGAGAAVLSAVLFLLFAMGEARGWALAAVAVGWIAFLGWVARTAWKGRSGSGEWKAPPAWVWLFVIPYAGLYLMHALSPEVQPDSLHYHLQLARQTQTTGGFAEGISFFNLVPQGAETLFALAYGVTGGWEPAAKLVHLLFLMASLPLLAGIGQRLGLGEGQAWAASLFYGMTPVVGMAATCSYTDAALAFSGLVVLGALLTDRPLAGGLAAGFCYAIKMTGGLAIAAGLLVWLWRRRPGALVWFGLGAMLVAGPWLVRSAWLTGNPLAPLGNQMFPNQHFHVASEQKLGEYLRTYQDGSSGGADWMAVPLDLAIRGERLQGLLGPVWVLLVLPIGLLALRWRQGRWIWLAVLVAGAPWLFNIGARFLIPALPFLAMAMFLPLTRFAAAVLVVVQAVVSWPAVLPFYGVGEKAWVLGVTPRGNPEQARRLATFVEANTTEGDRILDLADTPAAITRRRLVNAWQTAQGERLAGAMEFATRADTTLGEVRVRFAERPLDGVRLRFGAGWAGKAAVGIHEVRLYRGDGSLVEVGMRRGLWTLVAWPNVWEAGLAMDGNAGSLWQTWEPAKEGMFWELDTAVQEAVGEVRVVLSERGPPVEVWAHYESWRHLGDVPVSRKEGLNYRPAVGRYLRREGITHVMAAETADTMGRIATDLLRVPGDWGLERIGLLDNAALYRVMKE
jgi:hypothetical protein